MTTTADAAAGLAATDRGRGTAVVTGASSGIGAETARQLAAAGFGVVLGARRADRLAEVTGEIGPAARLHPLDVTDPESVRAFAAAVPECAVLVCNAGGALGLAPVAELDEQQWRRRFPRDQASTRDVHRTT